jgi:ABC-type glycerol-3-phosphate transport system substrate-binding protein
LPSELTSFINAGGSARDWALGQAAAVQFGYGFGRQAVSLQVAGEDIFMLCAPGFGTAYANPPTRAAGITVSASSKHPQEAWKVTEWLLGKEPAQRRARRAVGLPALKSLHPLLPQEQAWQRQALLGVDYELTHGQTVWAPFSAYITPDVLEAAWTAHEAFYLTGAINLDEFVDRVEEEVNLNAT